MSATAVRRDRRQWVLDALLCAVLMTPIAAALITVPEFGRLAAALAVMGAAVAVSRRWPLVSLAVVVLASLVDGNFSFSIPVMSYLVGLRDVRVRPAVAVFAVIMVSGSLINLAVLDTDPSQWFLLAATLLFAGVFPWLVGRYRTQQQHLVAAGWERAAHLERERLFVSGQARLRERARIAGELHDSVGHELSLIALRAAALEVDAGLSAHHREAAGRIRANAASATDRLHDSVGLLRDTGPAPLEPPTASVEQVVARAQASGLLVTLRRTGDPAVAPLTVERTAHRIVQESLTNAARHAPGGAVRVAIDHGADVTAVTVENDRAAQPTAAAGGGFGLVGLHERVRLTGGSFDAIATPTGFRVSARLVHAGPPAQEEPVAAVAVPELRTAQRRVRRSLVVAFVAPVAIAVITAVSYYPFAALGRVITSADFDRIPLGATRAELMLPERQARERPASELPAVPDGARCEFYSDGNFPFARATFRLCFAGDRLVTRDDLRKERRAP